MMEGEGVRERERERGVNGIIPLFAISLSSGKHKKDLGVGLNLI